MEERTHEKPCSCACRGWCDRTCGDGDARQCRLLHWIENAGSRIEPDRCALLAPAMVIALGLPPRLASPLALAPLVVRNPPRRTKRNGRSAERPFCILIALRLHIFAPPKADHLVEPSMNSGLRTHSGGNPHALVHRSVVNRIEAISKDQRSFEAMEERKPHMRNLILALAAGGVMSLAASVTPASAGVAGLTAPAVETNIVNARCHHHRWSSHWHCYRRHWHHRHYHWEPFHGHHHHRWHRRHRHWH